MLYVRKLFTQDLRDGKQIAFPKEPSYQFFSFDYIGRESDRRISFTFRANYEQFQEYDGKVIYTRLYAAGSESRMDGEVKAFIRDELHAQVDDLLIFKNKGTKHTEYEVMFVPKSNSKYYPLLLTITDSENHTVLSYEKDLFDNELDITFPLQQIFYGAPGTGKSHRIKEIIRENGIDEKEQVIRTTFHPDSDYSTFVGCYKPIMKSVPQTYVVEGNEKPVMADKDNQATKDEIVYDYTPQAFVQAYTKAWTTNKPVILVIEEINRGNCAQIFGDIFQLLDRGDDCVSEYEIKPDKALENYLREYFATFEDVDEQIKSGKIMKLPSNLYIWATMNTSDQSLFPIDSAFKRRWEWKYIKIAWPYKKNEDGSFQTDENGEKVHFNYSIEGGHDWWAFLQQINDIIDKMTNSADKQLGYFFAKAIDDIISYDTFVSKVCFYLWNDIFKTYALDGQESDLFKFTKKIKDKDGNEKEVIGHLSFPEFYDGDGNVVPDVARQFIEHVMAWNTEGKKENS